GPQSLEPDKVQNEDFALAGTIEADDGAFPFGIVADGVTSKTFWPARASRIAAFCAYEALKSAIAEGWRPERGDAAEVDLLLQKVADSIERGFAQDRSALHEAQAVPSKWDEAVYRQHADKQQFWYQTTLLLAVLGPKGGWFVFCGDGGAVRILADATGITDSKVALESGETVELPAAVSIGVTALKFKRVFVRPAPSGQYLHVVLAS